MKIAVLTSSIGSTQLLDPIPFDGVDYHAFVDYASDNSGWIKHPTCLLYTSPSPRDRG